MAGSYKRKSRPTLSKDQTKLNNINFPRQLNSKEDEKRLNKYILTFITQSRKVS